MVVKHCGFTAIVKVPIEAGLLGSPVKKQDFDIEEQPEGGSNALNVNRYSLIKLDQFSYFLFVIAYTI